MSEELKWIPVSEITKEQNYKRILICNDIVSGEGVYTGGNKLYTWWWANGTRANDITHWMPLPEPSTELVEA